MAGHLLFDPDCGFCTRSAQVLRRLGVTCEVEPITPARLQHFGVDPDRAMQEVPFCDEDGRVRHGAPAIAAALRTAPWPTRAAGIVLDLPLVRPAARVSYRWVARHRHQLPGGTASCQMPQ